MADLRAQLKARTDKLNHMMEAAAQSAAQIDDLKSQVETARVDAGELEELRELKKDIERKEKQQAAIIEHQVSLRSSLHHCLIVYEDCLRGARNSRRCCSFGLCCSLSPLACAQPLSAVMTALSECSLYCLLVALQAKRLEELDKLYREEVVSRKRAHNALQVRPVTEMCAIADYVVPLCVDDMSACQYQL